MIKITKDTNIHQLLLDGYYIVCSDYGDLEPKELCDSYWHLENAIGSPSGKSIYCYTFINDWDTYSAGFERWYDDYQKWLDDDGLESITYPIYACDINELQQFT